MLRLRTRCAWLFVQFLQIGVNWLSAWVTGLIEKNRGERQEELGVLKRSVEDWRVRANSFRVEWDRMSTTGEVSTFRRMQLLDVRSEILTAAQYISKRSSELRS